VPTKAPLAELLGDIRELTGSEFAALWRVSPAGETRHSAAALTLADFSSGDGKPPALDAKTAGLVTWVAQQELGETSTDGDRPRFAASRLPEPADAAATHRVLTLGAPRGRIGMPREHLRRWLPRFASRVASLTALLEGEEAGERAEANADLLLFTATQLHENRNVEDLGSSLCSAAMHMTGARRVALVRWNPVSNTGQVVYATRGHLVAADDAVDEDSQTGTACRNDAFVIVEDASARGDELQLYGGVEPPRSLGSFAIVPLKGSECVIGAIAIEADSPHQIREGDGKNLRLLALLGAAALETVWEIEEINRRARTDSLTGLANRRQFEERLGRIVAETNRFGGSCALVVLDIDRFKHVNDTFGHQAGDEVLRRVATTLQQAVRVVDLCARYGGEEMALLLPQTDLSGAARLAERLRQSVADRVILAGAHEISITVSLGVAAYPEGARDGEELFAAADRALYEAKRKGRNRVVSDRA